MLLIATIALGGATSCKSKKKLAKEAAAAEYAAKVEQAKKDLNAIINEETDWTLDQQTERVATIKSYNIDDQEVKDLIVKAEQKIEELKARKAEEERLKREEEARKKAAQSKFSVLDNTLGSIAGSATYEEANRKIVVAMQEFASPDIPVLIIISQENGVNDYDRPTTISKFLNYLKDKKQYKYKVESVKRDTFGKITELELIVKY
jgi:lipopolysaccharide export LptBFGC system permease protein LptF